MNKIYIYNSNFINLLTLIMNLIKKEVKPNNIKDNTYEPNLLEERVILNLENNENILNYFQTKWGNYFLKTIYYVYLSNNENKELIIYYVCLNALKYNKKVLNMRNLKCVSEALRISKYVGNEAHKLKGFLRFKELKNNILYGEIEPTNNVIEILSMHFKRRLANENWIIHDKKRYIAMIYDKKDILLIDTKKIDIFPKLSIEEEDYEDLWCTFYETIGIKERTNLKCRLNFMPKKYWKNIIEMREENETNNKWK